MKFNLKNKRRRIKAMATILKFFHILLTFLFFSSSISYADKLSSSSDVNSPRFQAEKLIRSFNLSPKESINTLFGYDESMITGPAIVEKPLMFPSINGSAPTVQELGHHAGYFKLPHSKAARLFYFFFESRNNTNDPVVIWLTGGPGCSSELALFYENGPFQITNDLTLRWNDYGWDKASNLIYVDQPVGTGFSYTTDESDIRHTEEGVSSDLYDFLQEFFKAHPKFAKNDFYITGESYAGHYIPAFAARVNQGNKAKEGLHINLKGFAIGNGLTNPAIQYQAYPDYALNMNLIQQSDYNDIKKMLPSCEKAINSCGPKGGQSCGTAYSICTNIFETILSIAGNINYYDIRKQCEGSLCYDFSAMERFLQEKSVKDALGVGNMDFVSCSEVVYTAMQDDWMRNLEVGIPAMLEDGIRMLIYAGEYDLICNWLGNSQWVNAMDWSGKKQFGAAKTVSFQVDGKEAGELKSYGPLSFLKVHNAGHMVPMDQPKASLQMLSDWMQGKLAVSDSKGKSSPQ